MPAGPHLLEASAESCLWHECWERSRAEEMSEGEWDNQASAVRTATHSSLPDSTGEILQTCQLLHVSNDVWSVQHVPSVRPWRASYGRACPHPFTRLPCRNGGSAGYVGVVCQAMRALLREVLQAVHPVGIGRRRGSSPRSNSASPPEKVPPPGQSPARRGFPL